MIGVLNFAFLSKGVANVLLTEDFIFGEELVLGEKIDISRLLPKVKNISQVKEVCTVCFESPSSAGKVLKRGYRAIPDRNWFFLKEKRVVLDPGQEAVADT